uniref:Uncharacterized protein n=1 Tax=Arundo donax TaxID=35708 RepID=A0A0A8Z931_ARUDO
MTCTCWLKLDNRVVDDGPCEFICCTETW